MSSWEQLRARYESELFGLAFALTGDELRARAAVEHALRRALSRYEDKRGSEALELFLYGWLGHHVPRPVMREGDAEWNAWAALAPKRRAVLALLLRGHLTEAGIADALGWTRSAVEKAAGRGLEQWCRASGGDRNSLQARLRSDASIPAPSRPGPAVLYRRSLPLVIAAALIAGVIISPTLRFARPSTAPAPDAARASDLDTNPRPLSLRNSGEDICPNIAGVRPFGEAPAQKAAHVARAFNAALVENDRRIIATYIDPFPGALKLRPRPWDHTEEAEGLEILHSAPAAYDRPAHELCGPAVAATSWKVVMQDATGEARMSRAAFYLVHRDAGWKVWGSY